MKAEIWGRRALALYIVLMLLYTAIRSGLEPGQGRFWIYVILIYGVPTNASSSSMGSAEYRLAQNFPRQSTRAPTRLAMFDCRWAMNLAM